MEYYGIKTCIGIRLYRVKVFEEIKSDKGPKLGHPPALMRRDSLDLAGR